MQERLILLLILGIIAGIDWKTHRIYNWIIFPAIGVGCYLTGYWIWAVVTFLALSYITFEPELNPCGLKRWGGGDVKLFTMIAAFIGGWVIAVLILSELLQKAYFGLRIGAFSAVPVAPFALIATLPFVLWV